MALIVSALTRAVSLAIMGRKRAKKNTSEKSTTGPVAGIYPTDTGEVELRPDGYLAGAWEVLVNGVPSSHIAEDPLTLEYEYMRWIVAGIDHWIPGRLNPNSLRVTHLGGGACSLARYMVAKYPASRNTVVELDGTLGTLVRDWFDLPRAPQLKIRQGDARAVTETFVPASRDIIIRDVFAGAETPRNITTVEFFELCKQSLGPGGLYIANCGDHSDLKGAHAEIKGLEEVFNHVAVIADPAMLKGRRYGNIILMASESEMPEGPDADAVTRTLLGGAVPAQYKSEAWTRKFAAAGIARHDVTPVT